eukprot:3283077-Amphidinium_carterae.2
MSTLEKALASRSGAMFGESSVVNVLVTSIQGYPGMSGAPVSNGKPCGIHASSHKVHENRQHISKCVALQAFIALMSLELGDLTPTELGDEEVNLLTKNLPYQWNWLTLMTHQPGEGSEAEAVD